MEAEGKENRADILNNLIQRVNRIEEMGIICQGGDIMIDTEEAAAIAHVERNTIFTWGQNAYISRYKLGSAVRFGLREFCELITSCRQPSISERKQKNT